MSFRFNWPEFDPTFYADAKTQLETALNKERKSKHIVDHIFVKELNMGTKPPELEILEICELSTDYFRGIFKLTYRGDSSIAVQTKIQANPLYNPPRYKPLHDGNYYPLPRHSRPDIVAAAQPLVIPMILRISDVRLNGIIVLSVSKTKGITLVFKNDALESLLVSSTFDIVSSVKSFLQQQIESQLRTFLQDTLPLVIHEFSLRHISNQQRQQQQQDILDAQQRQRKNRSTPFPSPILSNSSPPPSEVLASLHQQQYYDNCTDHYSGSLIDNDGNSSDIISIPDLTSTSSSTFSVYECFSDTSSEISSYVLHNGGDLGYGTAYMAPDYEKYSSYYMKATRPMKIVDSSSISSLYDNDSSSTDHHQQNQPYLSLYSPFPHSTTDANNDYDDSTTGGPTEENDQHLKYFGSSVNPSKASQLQSVSAPPPPPPRTILFTEPIILSLSSKRPTHNLLQRMQDLSTLSHTITIMPMDKNNDGCLVHKTGINLVTGQGSASMRRKKTPKRRVIRWNS